MRFSETDDKLKIKELHYAFASTVYGETLTACSQYGLCFAGFVTSSRTDAVADLQRRFPRAALQESADAAVNIFGSVEALHLVGTDFQRRVWLALMTVGYGQTISYSQLAARAGMPRAIRATASAVAANPLSIVIPCHRIIRSDGSIGQYYWGSELKKRILEAEQR